MMLINRITLFVFTSLLIFISACEIGSSNNFRTLEEAKEAIFEEEKINNEDIINEVVLDTERIIIFKQDKTPDTYSMALIHEKSKDEFIWYDTSAKIELENEHEIIGTRVTLYDDRELEITLGKNESIVEKELSEKSEEWSTTRTVQFYNDSEIMYIISIIL